MIVAAVCARKGSKGLPGKNERTLGGVPLLTRAVTTAMKATTVNAVVINTDIKPLSVELPAAMRHTPLERLERRPEDATDSASKWPVYQHILAWVQEKWPEESIDAIVDVDVSRPFVTARDVDECVKAWWSNSYADTVMAIVRAKKSPYFDIVEMDLDGRMLVSKPADPPFLCRQDLPPTFYHAGVYVIGADALRADSGLWDGKVYGYEVSNELAGFDIDGQLDWDVAEMLMERRIEACR